MGRIFEVRKHAMFARWNRMAKQFARIGKDITIAVKSGGTDPSSNPALRRVIQNARAVNMPKDKVEAAIKRASGKDATNFTEILYEGYAPHGVAVMVEAATDNPTRTVASVRNIFSKHNGNLGESNSVAWMFSKKGYIVVDKAAAGEEQLLDVVLEAGGDDLRDDGDSWEILSEPSAFEGVKEAVKALGIEPQSAQVAMLPQNYVKLEGKDASQMVKLMDALDDHDDVKQVWSNFDIEEKEIEASLA